MRYILILLLVFLNINAQEEEEKQNITFGLGPYFKTQPYKNVDTLVLTSSVIFFDNGIAYIRWSKAGVYFLGSKEDDYSWGFSLTVQPRVNGYRATDIYGMSERKSSLEGGLSFSAKAEHLYIDIMAHTDILDRHDSYIVNTEVGYDLKLYDFSLYPSLFFIYQSSSFMNYYYGVTKSEEMASRPQYTPNAGVQLGFQTYIKYPFTEKISAFINLRIDRLSQEAIRSPIVEEDYFYSGLFSLIYTFEY